MPRDESSYLQADMKWRSEGDWGGKAVALTDERLKEQKKGD
jgi:hypothetical protein